MRLERCCRHGKSAKPNQPNFVALFQGVGNRGKHAIDSLGGVGFGQPGGAGNYSDEIIFIHRKFPFC